MDGQTNGDCLRLSREGKLDQAAKSEQSFTGKRKKETNTTAAPC